MKYRRRRYGEDVVIYTTDGGNFATFKKSDFKDTWDASGVILKNLNQMEECN